MSAPASEAFTKAQAESRQLAETPSNEQLLKLYGLFKVGTGEDITKVAAPGMFAIKEKEKRKAWQAQVDRGITPEKAQEEYVELVEELKAKLGVKEAAA